jgi:hypothetical protein
LEPEGYKLLETCKTYLFLCECFVAAFEFEEGYRVFFPLFVGLFVFCTLVPSQREFVPAALCGRELLVVYRRLVY